MVLRLRAARRWRPVRAVTDPAPAAVARPLGALRLVLPYLRPHGARVAGALAALLASSGLVLAIGQGLRHLIDSGFAAGRPEALDAAALAMFGVVAALGAATALRFYLVTWLGERVAADLRRDAFARALSLSPAYYETARTGDVLSRLTADVGLLQALVGSAVSQGLRTVLTGLGALAMLVATSPRLALVVVAVVPLVVVPLLAFGRRERRLSRAAQERIADLAVQAEEAVNGVRAVQAFAAEPLLRARFSAGVEAALSAATRRVGARALLVLSVVVLGFGAVVVALWVGGRDVVGGRMTGGDLSAFVFYAVLLATSGASLGELWGEVQRASAAAERVGEILSAVPAVAAPAAPAILPSPARGAVAFEGIGFRYPARPERAALDGFDLRVGPGETVALVGPSGAGKTTVLHLLLRFYDPQAGVVRLDGVDVRAVDPARLRERLGLVPQDPTVFGTDAAENIRLGRPGATDAEVRAAAEAADAARFLDALPRGFATPLGPRGVTLSGGQRQRLAIARAVLRDPAVLLLDEATSALDAESEAAVQHALSVLGRDRTTIVVAHRLATVRRADRIVVLDGGRVVATGTHEGLVRAGGLYARLAALQFGDAGAEALAPATGG